MSNLIDSDKTLRPSSTDNDKTVRPGSTDDDKTLRPILKADKTLRASEADKTLRPGDDNEKTLRPATADIDKTLRFGESADKTLHTGGEDKTLRQESGTNATLRAEQQKEIEAITRSYDTEYLIKGLNYKVIDVISDGTGEAQIFLVENKGKQYVLKLYYVGIEPPPNHQILEIIRQTPGTGLLVDIIDHGQWDNPRVSGELRHYEIMSYCRGGSMDKVNLRGDEKTLCEIAKQMASAIDFCHKHGFIHRDIKPGNFLFADETQKQVLLGDFGISVKCDANGVARTDQARTRIYAAPEMYYTVPGENMVEIDTKSDFYSLGMVLLCLWMGEKEFKEREFELMKRKRTGDLPFPADLSDRTLKLIKALTVPQPEKRCGFIEIVRWAQGEDVFSDFVGEESKRSFSIIFDAGKNRIARSPEQLADFMRQDQNLAIKYLYTGKLTKWLNDNQRPELAAETEDIVEKRYPKDQTAGLYAACYILDVDMPYYDVKGRPRTTAEEIAQSLVENFSSYQSALANSNDPLFLFFNAHDLKQLTDNTVALFKKKGRQREALWRLIYTLDPSRPYELIDEKGDFGRCKTPEEIIHYVYEHTLSTDSWNDLTEESFLIWLSARDKGLVGKIRTQLKGFSASDAAVTYGVLYNLSPKVSFVLQMDETASNYYFTHTQVAQFINRQLMIYKNTPDNDSDHEYATYILRMLSDMKGSRLYFYLKSKGVYEDKIEWINYCFDFKSKDNDRKAGPYDWRVATFKTIKGLGASPYYYFKGSDKNITDLNDLKSIPSKEVKNELENGYLRDWLTVFFQEDPQKDLSPKFSYEQETVKYLEFIENIDSKDPDVSNFRIATKFVDKNLRRVRSRYRILTSMRILLGILCFIPIFGFAAVLCFYGLPFTENPLPGFSMSAIVTMGIIFGILIFVTSDFENLIGSAIVGFIVGAIVYYAIYFVLNLIMPYAHYILAGLLLLLAYYLIKGCYLRLPVERRLHAHLLKPGFEETGLEPLHFTYKANVGTHFESSIGGESIKYADYLKDCIRKFSYRSILSMIVVGGLAYLFVQYTPAFGLDASRFLQNNAKIQKLEGTWNGTFEGRNATLNITKAGAEGLKATIHVQYTNLTTEELIGNVNTVTNAIHFDDVNRNGTLDGQYNGSFTTDEMDTIEGTYENYTTKKQVTFNFKKAEVAVEN